MYDGCRETVFDGGSRLEWRKNAVG